MHKPPSSITYTFVPASKTITSTSFTYLADIRLIVNLTTNIVIYNPMLSTTGGTLSGNILTLTYDTNTMSSTDILQIFVDDGKEEVDVDLFETLQELVSRLAPLSSVIAHAGGTALRVQGVSMPSTAVTGPMTSAQHLANELTKRMAIENLTATIANINNCIGG